MSSLYEQISVGYANQRRADPRILQKIYSRLQDVSSLLNVGAGTGSYEPSDIPVTAVEPSMNMILQRTDQTNVVQGRAEALPFRDGEFETVAAILTVHHWTDKKKGLEECVRVARRRIVILTWDPSSEGFWLVQDYIPELIAFDRQIFPSVDEVSAVLGKVAIEPVPVPADCTDGFLGAFWQRPQAYLDKTIRSGMSSFSRIVGVEDSVERLRKDLLTSAWEHKYHQLMTLNELDIGYRIITVDCQ